MAQLTYRQARLSDMAQITSLIVRYAKALYPQMRPDTAKITTLIRETVKSGSDFAWVAERDGQIVAVLGALVHDALWAERKIANVIAWVSEAAGAGRELMRRLIAWAAPKRAVKLIGLSPMSDTVTKTCTLALTRLGFVSEGASLVRYN